MLLDKAKKVELIKYLPFFMQNYKEIQVILNSENKVIKEEWEHLKQAFKNNFIFLTDETGIVLFEKMMEITPDSSLTLSERQALVYLKWNSTIPYTFRWLEAFLKEYLSGTDAEATPTLENEIYHLEVFLRENEVQIGKLIPKLYEYLRKVIPANLTLITKISTKEIDVNFNENSGTIIYMHEKQIITNDWRF